MQNDRTKADELAEQKAAARDGVPEPGRIVARRISPVGWFIFGLTALAILIAITMVVR